jgi:hypothetical protein
MYGYERVRAIERSRGNPRQLPAIIDLFATSERISSR